MEKLKSNLQNMVLVLVGVAMVIGAVLADCSLLSMKQRLLPLKHKRRKLSLTV